MALVNGEVWFAPQVRMVDVDFTDFESLVDSFARRVYGFFLAPIAFLRTANPPEACLFVAVLTCATTIEFLATVERPNENDEQIARWLAKHIPDFNARIGDQTLARFFERRYRHHVAHKAFVSLGRLGDIDGIVNVEGPAVTVNPFALGRAIDGWLDRYVDELRSGARARTQERGPPR
jgi:hypothetical protein